MFIRKLTKKNKGSDKQYHEYRLARSVRMGDKVSQLTVMVMQDIRVSKNKWKALADAIEALLQGQEVLFLDKQIQTEAQRWFQAYLEKKSLEPIVIKDKPSDDYESISISSIKNHQLRSIGAEHIAYSMYKELGFHKIFRELGFNQKQMNDAALSILGRVLEPSSELATNWWAKNLTGLGSLMNADFSRLSHNSLYRITDQIYKHKEHLEHELRQVEYELFNLDESIFLYDLTNTYLEGMAKDNPKARFGYSKEKRYDCRLLTLGLVIDDQGFPKRSRVMEGSVSEASTLQEMLACLSASDGDKPVTVIMDAGISSEANLQYLREQGYHYICVARNKAITHDQFDYELATQIRSKDDSVIHTQLFRKENECLLYCVSEKMGLKESAMMDKFCTRYETNLDKISATLASGRGKRKYEYILERVFRLKEQYSAISSFYEVQVEHDEASGKAVSLTYKREKQEEMTAKYSGSYCLRTSHTDLDNAKIWSLYMLLNNVEQTFRTLKSDLNFRPVHHQKENRAEAHLFISVLAYHIVHAIRHKLKHKGINLSWSSLRKMMRTHQLILTSMQTQDKKTITVLDTSEPEECHKEIYTALKLNPNPIKRKITKRQLV